MAMTFTIIYIRVESGVGCASVMLQAALKGQKEAECSCG